MRRRRASTRDGVDGCGDEKHGSGDDFLVLHTEVGFQPDAVRDDHDDERAEDGVARLTAASEQRRSTDDGGGDGEQQDVAGAEVQLRTTGVGRQEDASERGEARS